MVYCNQPAGFVDPARPEMVCWLNRSLYGLKQASRAWYSRFATFLVTLGFTEAKSDTSLFVYRHGDETAYLLLYVDDIVLTASNQHLLQRIITSLQQEFAMKDLGECIDLGVRKFNVNTEVRNSYLESLKKPETDLIQVMVSAKNAMKAVVAEKLRLFGSAGKA
ncbi:hypothetical protein U9M48_029040 [Paspalum notatum var. saurae]|uniref:Reverse transcriptase Ty1/copia-type domain-containing protein n=1 Tax=Paspalum notatum var. saurae TaxID=547442 RepID=A0AAQ3TXK7_PASNO